MRLNVTGSLTEVPGGGMPPAFKGIPKDAGLRHSAGERRLVVGGVPATLGLVEGEQRLINGGVGE
jgi:hypothetical protein